MATESKQRWLPIGKAAEVAGCTRTWLQALARRDRVERRKYNGIFNYLEADCIKFRDGHITNQRVSVVSKPMPCPTPESSCGLPSAALAEPEKPAKPTGNSDRRLLRAKWVFEGLDIGSVKPDQALAMLRTIIYAEG